MANKNITLNVKENNTYKSIYPTSDASLIRTDTSDDLATTINQMYDDYCIPPNEKGWKNIVTAPSGASSIDSDYNIVVCTDTRRNRLYYSFNGGKTFSSNAMTDIIVKISVLFKGTNNFCVGGYNVSSKKIIQFTFDTKKSITYSLTNTQSFIDSVKKDGVIYYVILEDNKYYFYELYDDNGTVKFEKRGATNGYTLHLPDGYSAQKVIYSDRLNYFCVIETNSSKSSYVNFIPALRTTYDFAWQFSDTWFIQDVIDSPYGVVTLSTNVNNPDYSMLRFYYKYTQYDASVSTSSRYAVYIPKLADITGCTVIYSNGKFIISSNIVTAVYKMEDIVGYPEQYPTITDKVTNLGVVKDYCTVADGVIACFDDSVKFNQTTSNK